MRPTPSTSASPAPFYRLRSATHRADGPSPSKRRKLATPAPVSSSSSSFCHRNCSPNPQLDTERRASSSRVLSMWSALEDKYARRLDEDDIVDLRIGGLVKDRGVLSSKAGTWDIGCFADPEEAQGQGNSAQEDEDEDDEIGVWGSDAELDHRFNPVHIPPVRELDPEDAEDLRAFLAAEEARKALHGVDDDSSQDEAEKYHKDDEPDENFDANAETEESILEVEAGSVLALSPTESDDELAGYDETVGEGALLWEVSTELSNCSEPLGPDVGTTPKHSHALPSRNHTPMQLRTPPLSRSSVRPPSGPVLPKLSPRPSNRPPLNLPPPSPPKSRKTVARISPPKKPASTQPSPEKRTETPEAPSSRRRHRSMSGSRCTPTASTSVDESMPSSPSHYTSERASSTRPPLVPSLLSHDFWPPYPRSTHTPAPASPMSYPSLPNHTREGSTPPHPDAQIYIAQAMQSLSYAFGVPPPPPSFHFPHRPHAQRSFSSSLGSPPQWVYPPPYYPHHSQPHAPASPLWPYPPYPYPYPYQYSPVPHAHPALPPSPATPLMTPASGCEPPSSAPDFSSSPLSGKCKGKKVSFPQQVVESHCESDSSTDSGVEREPEMCKSKGKEKRKRSASSAVSSGHPRWDSKESPSSDTKGKGHEKDNLNKPTHSAARLEVSIPRPRKASSCRQR